jgi:MFS family permease
LVPLYLVRYVHASDQWISIITTSQIAVMVLGYFFWTRLGRRRGTRAVLVWTTLGLSLYPFFMALTASTWQIAVIAGVAGIFQAGLDLVFFDELMKVVPIEYSAIFVGLAQSIQYLAAIASPLIGTWIADQWSLPVGLFAAAGLRFLGFFLFFVGKKKLKPVKALP